MHIELDFPEQKSNDWSIETFIQNGFKYQKLIHHGIIRMVNTPDIVADFEDFLTKADGSILINGLGIGMCNVHLLDKATVTDITVIEYDKSLIDFIAPLFEQESRCTIIHSDAFLYEPPAGKTYDFVWHDIWTLQSPNNLKDMEILFDKYKNKAKWQGAWRQEQCQLQAEQDAARRKMLYGE